MVNLTTPSVSLAGPFNFQDTSENEQGCTQLYQQYIPAQRWHDLALQCTSGSISPPSLLPKTKASKQKRKRN
jgi:hypothetical protein